MKKHTIILILLVFSVGLLLPIYDEQANLTVLPNREVSFVYNNHNPTIKLQNDITAVVNVTIFKLNPIDDGEDQVKSTTYANSIDIDGLEPGIYRIVFVSSVIVNITIQGYGVYLTSIIIFLILLIANAILYYRRYMD